MRQWSSGISVGFPVVTVWEVNVALQGVYIGQVEGDTIADGTVDVPEGVFGGSHVPRKRASIVGGKEGDGGGQLGTGVGGEPVEAANDVLILLCQDGLIGVIFGGWVH